MGKYNVKKVVKMEQKLEELRDPKSYRLRDNWLFPMGLATAMGTMMTTTIGMEGIMSSEPVLGTAALVAAFATAYAGKRTLELLVQDETRKDLYEELNTIYNEMGDDFKAQVNEAIETEKAKKKAKEL